MHPCPQRGGNEISSDSQVLLPVEGAVCDGFAGSAWVGHHLSSKKTAQVPCEHRRDDLYPCAVLLWMLHYLSRQPRLLSSFVLLVGV